MRSTVNVSGIATLKKQYFLNKNIVLFMNFHRRYFQEFGIQNGKEGQLDNFFHQALLIHADLIITIISITLYSYYYNNYLYHIMFVCVSYPFFIPWSFI